MLGLLRLAASRVLTMALGMALATPVNADDRETCIKELFDVAIAACGSAIASDTYRGRDLAILFFNRGLEYDKMSDYDRAVSDYNEAIQLDPIKGGSDIIGDGFNNRCNSYRKKGEYDRAMADCNQAIRFNPKHPRAFTIRGAIYISQGQYDLAIADFDRAIQIDRKFALAIYSRGIAKQKKGDMAGGNAGGKVDPNQR